MSTSMSTGTSTSKNKKLPERAQHVLLVIYQRTQDFGMWRPADDARGEWDYCRALRRGVCIGGAGDAQVLRALLRRGLTEYAGKRGDEEHIYRTTEDGALEAERILSLLYPGGERP
jgi:hypothetical protein